MILRDTTLFLPDTAPQLSSQELRFIVVLQKNATTERSSDEFKCARKSRKSDRSDGRGLTTTITWDNLQRLTTITYPDGTYVSNVYSKLDLVQTFDRMRFSNSFAYDSMRRMVYATNANGAVTLQ